jgi:hypothetical protein
MEDMPGILDEPLLIDLVTVDKSGDGIDWSFANAIGEAILALSDELKRRKFFPSAGRMTRTRGWSKMAGHDCALAFGRSMKAGASDRRGRPQPRFLLPASVRR